MYSCENATCEVVVLDSYWQIIQKEFEKLNKISKSIIIKDNFTQNQINKINTLKKKSKRTLKKVKELVALQPYFYNVCDIDKDPSDSNPIPDDQLNPTPTTSPTDQPSPKPSLAPTPIDNPIVGYVGFELPASFYAADFDLNGYNDTDPKNIGGYYRMNEAVDITNIGNEPVVGWTVPGEWLNFSVYTKAMGSYTIQIEAGALNAGGVFKILVNGVPLGENIQVPISGSWEKFNIIERDVQLSFGQQKIKIEMVSKGLSGHVASFRKINIIKKYSQQTNTIPGEILFADYDNKGAEISYSDTTKENIGKKYRTNDAVDITIQDSYPIVGWTRKDEWLKYTVITNQSATYRVKVLASALGDGASINISTADSNNKILSSTKLIKIPNTGSWSNHKPVYGKISLKKGVNILKVNITGEVLNAQSSAALKSMNFAYDYDCIGDLPNNASLYENDNFNLNTNTDLVYSKQDTIRKCEYGCNPGFDAKLTNGKYSCELKVCDTSQYTSDRKKIMASLSQTWGIEAWAKRLYQAGEAYTSFNHLSLEEVLNWKTNYGMGYILMNDYTINDAIKLKQAGVTIFVSAYPGHDLPAPFMENDAFQWADKVFTKNPYVDGIVIDFESDDINPRNWGRSMFKGLRAAADKHKKVIGIQPHFRALDVYKSEGLFLSPLEYTTLTDFALVWYYGGNPYSSALIGLYNGWKSELSKVDPNYPVFMEIAAGESNNGVRPQTPESVRDAIIKLKNVTGSITLFVGDLMLWDTERGSKDAEKFVTNLKTLNQYWKSSNIGCK